MRRRKFVIGGAVVLSAPPLCVLARTSDMPPVVGFLGIAAKHNHLDDIEALKSGLKALGYVASQTILFEDLYAEGRVEVFAGQLDDLLARGVDVIVVPGLAAALAVRERSPQTPVVAVGLPSTVIYPDLFASLHRPGGSVTGFSHFGEDLATKRVELLREIAPSLETVAVLHNGIDPLYRAWGEKTGQAALAQGLHTVRLQLESPSRSELDTLMSLARDENATGLIVVRDFLTATLQDDIIAAASGQRMATMAEQREWVESGALMSYGASLPDLFRRAASYVAEILEGASPAEMPIQLATEFELVINSGTAGALGLSVPSSLLLRADEVIE